ncbi:hypothetical protein WDW89_11040 [Deltaproteobacteria bacterium TL4]
MHNKMIYQLFEKYLGKNEGLDENFIKTEMQEIKEYVEHFPEEEREQRMLEWVDKNASAYRFRWQHT